MLSNLLQMHLNLLQKEYFKKQDKKLVISLVIRLLKISQKNQKRLPQKNSETVRNEHDTERPKEKNISPEEREKLIDDLRLK